MKKKYSTILAITALLILISACSGSSTTAEIPQGEGAILGNVVEQNQTIEDEKQESAPPERQSYAGEVAAPEFPAGLDWLNVERPLTLEQLKGKVVMLDFWTYGCINCYHIIPDLKALEEEFDDELVVIGVHSAKFANEGQTENIRQIIRRYELEHPVVNDGDFVVWGTWGANAWPTTVLIDPAGNVVGGHSGEGVYEVMQPVIRSLVLEFDEKGVLDRTPLAMKLEGDGLPETTLSFPGKVLIDQERDRLYIADSNHNRIVVADPGTGEIQQVFGSGDAGFEDGNGRSASFNKPQGLALSGSTLYVADTNNHAVRAIDLEQNQVSTIIGTGQQARSYPPAGGIAPNVDLSSPWDLELTGSSLLIAMAGSHQIWSLDLNTRQAGALVGSGREGTRNADLRQSELAQPSGLALDGNGRIYFADSESSSIRWADIGSSSGKVGLLAGSDQNLFDFGDADGVGDQVRLQHPLGVVIFDGSLYIADTYNSKIKRANLESGEVQTILGGEQGWKDGRQARFYEPGGLDAAGGKLYVADTNNHAVRVVDLNTLETKTLVLYGIERFEQDQASDIYQGELQVLDAVEVREGKVEFSLDIRFPEGYKINPLAPSSVFWSAPGVDVDFVDGGEQSIESGALPHVSVFNFAEGKGSLLGDLSIYYCEAEKEELCLIDRIRIEIPVEVGAEGTPFVELSYTVPEPDF